MVCIFSNSLKIVPDTPRNDVYINTAIRYLVQCSSLVRTRLQVMRVAVDGLAPDEESDGFWTDLVRSAQAAGAKVHDVLLYGLERKVHQPGAERLSKLPAEELLARGEAIKAELGLPVQVHP